MSKILPTIDSNKNLKINNLIPFSLHKRRLKYQKLPAQRLKLSVVKLDGSSFSFHVPRNATVSRLKSAIEEEFSLSHNDKENMLWPLVWSHFCLCYGGQKLISDKASIESYGIKDGDQLQFVQHLSTNQAAALQSSQNNNAKFMKCLMYNHKEDDLVFPARKATFAHSLKELLSCSKFVHLKRQTIFYKS